MQIAMPTAREHGTGAALGCAPARETQTKLHCLCDARTDAEGLCRGEPETAAQVAEQIALTTTILAKHAVHLHEGLRVVHHE